MDRNAKISAASSRKGVKEWWKVSRKEQKDGEKRKRETRCLSGVLSMHSAEKLNLNRGWRPWGYALSRGSTRWMWNVSRLARCNRGNWLAPTDELNKYRREERAADCRERRVCVVSTRALQRLDPRGFQRTRSREVATLYNGMFSTDPGIGWNGTAFRCICSFDRVNFLFPCLFPQKCWNK